MCWRNMFLDRTRLRFEGMYISRNQYIKVAVQEFNVRRGAHFVAVYFRYLRYVVPYVPLIMCELYIHLPFTFFTSTAFNWILLPIYAYVGSQVHARRSLLLPRIARVPQDHHEIHAARR